MTHADPANFALTHNPIVSCAELAELIEKKSVVILDCRFSLSDTELGTQQYRQGHIPGAHYLHLDRDLSGPKGIHGGRHPLPNPAQLAAKLGELGIDGNTRVVAYDDSRFSYAARTWWLLRYLGHESVAVLDGGFQAWRDAGLAEEQFTAKPPRTEFTPRVKDDWIIDSADIRKSIAAATPTCRLIDSRDPKRYQCLEEPIDPVAGHIPGALNFLYLEASDERGFFKSAEAQKARWQTLTGQPLAAYCGSGVTACVNLLSLAVAGIPAKLYPGSWSDWCSYDDTPKHPAA
mgnify:CR=1 FL=1